LINPFIQSLTPKNQQRLTKNHFLSQQFAKHGCSKRRMELFEALLIRKKRTGHVSIPDPSSGNESDGPDLMRQKLYWQAGDGILMARNSIGLHLAHQEYT